MTQAKKLIGLLVVLSVMLSGMLTAQASVPAGVSIRTYYFLGINDILPKSEPQYFDVEAVITIRNKKFFGQFVKARVIITPMLDLYDSETDTWERVYEEDFTQTSPRTWIPKARMVNGRKRAGIKTITVVVPDVFCPGVDPPVGTIWGVGTWIELV